MENPSEELDVRRPSWLLAWQDYPHSVLSVKEARELNGYRVWLEATVRDRERQRDELQRQNIINLRVAENALKSEEELQRQLDAARKASLDAERRLKAVPESLLCDQRDPCSYDHTCRIHKALAELRRIAGGENG